jgi:hypothetical protein
LIDCNKQIINVIKDKYANVDTQLIFKENMSNF